LKDSFVITPTLNVEQRAALEHLLFFNVNQHRVLPGIQRSIQSYGEPRIVEVRGNLRIWVGDMEGVQTLFAVSTLGPPVGFVVFVRLARGRFVVLHLGVEPRLRSNLDVDTAVLLELMREVRSTARAMRGVDRIELVYNAHRTVRLNRENNEPVS
jgi:hypothetical protein